MDHDVSNLTSKLNYWLKSTLLVHKISQNIYIGWNKYLVQLQIITNHKSLALQIRLLVLLSKLAQSTRLASSVNLHPLFKTYH